MAVTLGPLEQITIGPNGVVAGANQQTAALGAAPVDNYSQDPFAALESTVGTATTAVPVKPSSTFPSLFDIPVGIYEGFRRRLPEQLGQAMQMSGIAPESGKALVEWARKGESEAPKSFVREGAEMIAPSITVPGVLYYGGKLISAIPNPVAKVVGTGMQLAAPVLGPTTMGLSEAQSTKEAAEKAGVDPGNAPLINGVIEAIGETIGTVFLGRLFGIKEVGGEVKQTFKQFLKEGLFKTLPAENITEMGQQYGQSLVDKAYGIRPDANPLSDALDVIGPTTVMTLLIGAANATHRAVTGKFAKEETTEPTPTAVPPSAAVAGAVSGAAGEVKAPANVVPENVGIVPDIYTMSPEIAKAWESLIASEQGGKPSVETQTYEVSPEGHPVGSIVKLGENDFIIDNYTPEGVEGRRIIKNITGGLQGEVSDDVLKLYDVAKSTLSHKDRTERKTGRSELTSEQTPEQQEKQRAAREADIYNIVTELATRPGTAAYTKEDIDRVSQALINPLHEEKETTDTEIYPVGKLLSKEPRIIPAAQKNLTMEELKKQNFQHIDDVIKYIIDSKQSGVNVNKVVKTLQDSDAIFSLLPKEEIKKKQIAIPNLFMSKPRETISEDEIDAALDSGAQYRVIPEMTKDGKKTGKMVIDYFPRDFRFFFKKRDYPNTEEGNKKLSADVKAKREYLQDKLKSFKRPEFWRIIEDRDEKGRIKSIKMARLVPEHVKSTSKWMAPTADKVLEMAKKATPERRRALASDMFNILKMYISSKYIAGEKVRLRPETGVDLVSTLTNYIERNRDKISPENLAKINEYITGKEEASEAEMDKLFGPVGEEAADEVFNIGGTEEKVDRTSAIPSMPGEETFNLEAQSPNTYITMQGVRRAYLAGQMMKDLQGYISGKGKISENRFANIVYNILRFKGGREVVANFLAGKQTGAEVIKKANIKGKVEQATKGKEKVKLTDDQWRDYRDDVREQLAKISNIDTSKKRLKILYREVVSYLVNNKKITEKEAEARVEKIKKEALARAIGSVTKAEEEAAAAISTSKEKEKPAKSGLFGEKDDRRPLYTRRNDLMRAALTKMTGLDVSKEDNIKKIAASVIDKPVPAGKEMVDEDKFKELNRVAYKKAKEEFEAGMLSAATATGATVTSPKPSSPEKPKEKEKTAESKKKETKETRVEWDDFGEKGQEYYKLRIRSEFGKLAGKDFSKTRLGNIREYILDTNDVHGKKITKEIITGITFRIWEETAKKFAPEKYALMKAEQAEREEKAASKPSESGKEAFMRYQALRKEAGELGLTVPKGTKIEVLEAMINARKKGRTDAEVAAAMREAAKKASTKEKSEELDEEETEKSYDTLFGESKPSNKKPEPSKPKEAESNKKGEAKPKKNPEPPKSSGKPFREYASLPNNAVIAGKFKSIDSAQAALDRILSIDPTNMGGYEAAVVAGEPVILKGKVISKPASVETVVPTSKEAMLKREANEIAKQRSAIRTTISEFLRIVNINRDDDKQLKLNKEEIESLVSDIHKQFKIRGGGSKKELASYAANKIRIKFNLPVTGEAAITNTLLSVARETGVDLDTLEVIQEDINRDRMSHEEEIAMLIASQERDAFGDGEEAHKVTEIPNIDDLTGREIYEFMVNDIASRIPLVKDPVLRTRLKNMLKIDLSRTDTRWQQAERDAMELMAHFGKTSRQEMGDEYRSKVMAYIHQMRMVYGRMLANPAIYKIAEQMTKAKYPKAVVEDFIWSIGAPYYYRQSDINHWIKQLKDPSYTRASMRTNSTVKQRENWLWLGKHWAIRKDINNGKSKPIYYYMTELTPELRNELGITEDVIKEAAENGKARYRPIMHDTVISVTTDNGSYEIVRKYNKEFIAIDKESMFNENNVIAFKLLGMDAANKAIEATEYTSVSNDELQTDKTRKTPLSLNVESIRKELPTATIVYEKSPGVFHVGFNNFSIEIRNSEIQYYALKNGKIVKIDGRWKIKEGGRPIIEVSKLSKGIDETYKTLRHEIFHMAWDIYLTNKEQNMLIDLHRKSDTESRRDIIERVASIYESWNPEVATKSEQIGLFKKIMNGIKDILWKLHGIFFGKTYSSRDALFGAIRSGSIYARPLKLNISLDSKLKKGIVIGGNEMPTVIIPRGLSPIISDPNMRAKAEWTNLSEKRIETPLSKTIQSSGLIDYAALDAIDERLKEEGMLATMNENTLPYNRSAWRIVIDWLKSATDMKDIGKQLSGREVGRIEHYLSNPLFLGTKFIEWAKAIAIEKDRSRNFQSDKYLYVKRTVNFQALNTKEQESLDPLWVYGSAIAHKYFTEEELKNPDIVRSAYEAVGSKLKNYNLTERAIKGYLEMVEAAKKLWAEKLEMARLSLLKPFANTLKTEEFAELTRLFKLFIKGEEPKNIKEILGDEKWISTYEKDGKTHKTNNLRKAYNKLSKRYSDIQARFFDKQYLEGYAPLLHGSGPYYVAVKRTLKDQNGKEKVEYVWSHHAKTEQHKAELEAAVRKHISGYSPAENEKIEVISGRSTQPEDSVYFMVGDMNMVRILDLAIADMRSNNRGMISIEQAEALLDNITDAIVDVRRIRGAGVHDIHRHMIKWDEQKTVGGYQTTDFKDIWNSYFFGYYGMRNKFDASIKHMELLKEVKRNTPLLFEDLVQYAQDNMRNKDQYDRAIGMVKNGVFYWYLGAKISTALLQITQNFVVGIPRMAMEMYKTKDAKHAMFAAEGYFMKAMWDIGLMRRMSPNISVKERAMLEYMERRGELMDRFMQEIKISAATHSDKAIMRGLEILGWPMTYTEIFNRRSTALAYYRFLKDRGGLTEQEIYDKIDTFIDTTHWWYGPANAPAIARGGGAFSRLAQLSYTFRAFTHHYVLSLWYAFQNNGGKAGAVYAARSFAWLIAIGGIPALPWIDDFIELVTKVTGIPIRMEAQKAIRKSLGSGAEKFLASGAIGVLGDIDLSTAIKPAGLPWPLSGTIGESTMGVYAGLANKFYRAIEAGKVNDWVKFSEAMAPTAVENMVKAYRLSERGMTTSAEKVVYGPHGKPIKLNQGETMMQFVGLKPYRASMLQHELWENKVIQEVWNERKAELHKMQRIAQAEHNYPKLHEVSREFTKFNLSIPKELRGIVTPIQWAEPSRIDKRMGMVWGKFGTAAPE